MAEGKTPQEKNCPRCGGTIFIRVLDMEVCYKCGWDIGKPYDPQSEPVRIGGRLARVANGRIPWGFGPGRRKR